MVLELNIQRLENKILMSFISVFKNVTTSAFAIETSYIVLSITTTFHIFLLIWQKAIFSVYDFNHIEFNTG